MGAGARRSADWLKIKTARRQEAGIVGFTAPRRSRPYFGALVLAVRDRDGWRMSATSARASATPGSMSSTALPRGAFRSIGAQSTDTEGLPVNFLTVFCA
jgi:ATP-dependent DNA ligase